jgi:hypothetical protein
MQDWYKFYGTLLIKDRTESIEEEEYKMESTNLTVSDIDVDTVLKNVNSRKSPGPGNINLALIKYYKEMAFHEMKTGYLIQIHMKGENRKCKNCRGINITNPFIKILGNIIKNWIEKRYKGHEEQGGFTKGRSTVEHIYVIRQILEKCNMQQEDISLIIYDLEKAYDRVPRKLLWLAFRKPNVKQSVIQIIRTIHNNNKCRIKIRSICQMNSVTHRVYYKDAQCHQPCSKHT